MVGRGRKRGRGRRDNLGDNLGGQITSTEEGARRGLGACHIIANEGKSNTHHFHH